MHIPDGFLDVKTWGGCWLVSVAGLGFCLKRLAATIKDKMVPLMGVSSAFIFASQMVNFPVAGGTSGHLLGGVLAAVLLGPWGGALVIAVVLIVQCLIFQDGGLTALGANILNMSFLGSVVPYYIYAGVKRVIGRDRGVIIGAGVAAWISVVLASSACALELAISGTSPLSVTLPAMAAVHAVIGVVEAIITCLVISFVLKVRPDLIYREEIIMFRRSSFVFRRSGKNHE